MTTELLEQAVLVLPLVADILTWATLGLSVVALVASAVASASIRPRRTLAGASGVLLLGTLLLGPTWKDDPEKLPLSVVLHVLGLAATVWLAWRVGWTARTQKTSGDNQ